MMAKFDLTLLPPAPTLEFEQKLWDTGLRYVAGIDEAGRGPLAGPVAAVAVILPRQASLAAELDGVRDSKQMTPGQRSFWAARLKERALAWAAGFASSEEIDTLGILTATRLAVRRSLEGLTLPAEHLLLDYLVLPADPRPQTPLVKGDCRSLSIAAASILAKTARDALLAEMDRQYPGYGFAAHKGYGTPEHRRALARLGPCPIHRRTFKGVEEYCPERVSRLLGDLRGKSFPCK